MKIIPAIDIIEGKCVRLSQGDYNKKTIYNEDPLEVAKQFEDFGIKFLHLVDLDGARSSKVINLSVLERIASKTNLYIDFGGGVKSDDDIRAVFNAGAKQITAGSIAVKNQAQVEDWLDKYGNDKIILGADVKDEFIVTQGWEEKSNLKLEPFLQKYLNKGIRDVICTDVSKDGMLQGSSIELYQKIIKIFPEIQLIASGGIYSVKELERLRKMGVHGAIIGKAIYEGKISLKDLQDLINKNTV
jgi:phosphoribosylformimino-5-aminoimidazole carboxamide ribotide isomerase